MVRDKEKKDHRLRRLKGLSQIKNGVDMGAIVNKLIKNNMQLVQEFS